MTIRKMTFTIILLKKQRKLSGKKFRTTAVRTINITIIVPSMTCPWIDFSPKLYIFFTVLVDALNTLRDAFILYF